MELILLLLFSVINGALSMSEIAVLSARKIRLKQAADRGDRGARAALLLAESPTRFLSTVQIGITLIGILSGAFGEAALADDLAGLIAWVGPLAPYSDRLATVLIVIGITYVSLVVGELVPKRIALGRQEKIAAAVARPMRWISTAAAPVVSFLSLSTELLIGALNLKPAGAERVSEEEVRHMIEKGAQEGLFHATESDIIDRVFEFGDLNATSVMVPRQEVAWLEVGASKDEAIATIRGTGRNQFPLCRDGLDHVAGVVHVRDLVVGGFFSGSASLESLAKASVFVPETLAAVEILERLKTAEAHLVFVVDEYGSVEGIITLNDLVQALIGHVRRHATDEPWELRRQDGSWLLDGLLPAWRLRALLDVDSLPGEDEGAFATLAGFVLTQLGRIPHVGDHFQWRNFRFEVLDLDGGRIDKVLLQALPLSSEGLAEEV